MYQDLYICLDNEIDSKKVALEAFKEVEQSLKFLLYSVVLLLYRRLDPALKTAGVLFPI